MSQLVDLRKVSIKSEQDVMDFLELVVTTAPKIVSFMKDQKIKNISLRNQVRHLRENPPTASDQGEVTDPDASVLDRLGRRHRSTPSTKTAAQKRLEEMKAAGKDEKKPVNKPVDEGENSDQLPPAPAAPGDIGKLNVPDVDPKAPTEPVVEGGIRYEQDGDKISAVHDATFVNPQESAIGYGDTKEEAAAGLEKELQILAGAPTDGGTVDSAQASSSDEEAAKAAGSKSERATDDSVQPETPSEPAEETLSPEEAEAQAALAPTPADTTPVADKVAAKGKNSKKVAANKKK